MNVSSELPFTSRGRAPDAPDAPVRQRRATDVVLRGRRRAAELSRRLATALREARLAAGLTQAEAAARARISQAQWSRLERATSEAQRAGVEEWAVAAEAVGLRLAAFMERASGATLPRDIEHLLRQNAVVSRGRPGGWLPAPEMPLDIGAGGHVVDVMLTRAVRREATVVEIWDWLDDVGAALRSFDEKVAAVRRQLSGWHVQGTWVMRGTRRNRDLVRGLGALFAARFPADGEAWLRALDDPNVRLPDQLAIVWTPSASPDLQARPRRRPRPRTQTAAGQATEQ